MSDTESAEGNEVNDVSMKLDSPRKDILTTDLFSSYPREDNNICIINSNIWSFLTTYFILHGTFDAILFFSGHLGCFLLYVLLCVLPPSIL